MKNSTPDFPPLTPRQLDLLNKIKAEKEKLKTLPPGDPKTGIQVPEFYEIQKRIDALSVKALRSGVLRSRPAESRRPGFCLVFDSRGEYAEVLPGFGDFQPGLPTWAKNHFVEWIRMLPLQRHDARETLRKTNIVGIETGMKRPMDLRLLFRVLELRGVEEKDGPDIENVPIPDSLGEMMDQSLRLAVTEEMLKQREAEEKKKTRTRKEDRPWHWVIKKLVEEGLLPKEITHQAFKQMLKNRYPHYPWDEV